MPRVTAAYLLKLFCTQVVTTTTNLLCIRRVGISSRTLGCARADPHSADIYRQLRQKLLHLSSPQARKSSSQESRCTRVIQQNLRSNAQWIRCGPRRRNAPDRRGARRHSEARCIEGVRPSHRQNRAVQKAYSLEAGRCSSLSRFGDGVSTEAFASEPPDSRSPPVAIQQPGAGRAKHAAQQQVADKQSHTTRALEHLLGGPQCLQESNNVTSFWRV